METERRLYLLRHAKSDWADPGTPDHDHPLADRGRRAGEALRRHLADQNVEIDLVLCSTARRTRETWAAVESGVSGNPEVRFEPTIYEASPGTLLHLLQEVPADTVAVLLVGHNPGIGDLALGLAGGSRAGTVDDLRGGYPTGALSSFTLTSTWVDLGRDGARLESVVRPRELPDA